MMSLVNLNGAVLIVFLIKFVKDTGGFEPISGASFYHECEKVIKKELEKLSTGELEEEAKLTRVLGKDGNPSFFFPQNKTTPESKLFAWKSKNSTVESVIIIGINEKSESNDFVPFGWMSGTFVTLKIVNESANKQGDFNYYALVAYVRKDMHGREEVELEWDRWSPRVIRNILRRETAVEAAETFTVDTFLCAYGSCACAACKCHALSQQQLDEEEEEEDDDDAGGSRRARAAEIPAAKEAKDQSKNLKRRGKQGLATALSFSSKGKTHSKSVAKGRSNSRSGSISKSSNAVAESYTNEGRSGSYASGNKSSLAESSSRTGDAKSYSEARHGFSQASASSYGGRIEASASRAGAGDTEYNYYDDDEADNVDADSLIKDTNKAFAEAYNRSRGLKASTKDAGFRDDICMREYAIELSLTLLEWKSLVMNGNASAESGDKFKKYHKDPIFLFKNLLRYGIDVELGVNTSVLIASVISGFEAPREACCGLRVNPSTVVGNLLQTFGQDCNSDFGTQVSRLEKSYSEENLKNILKSKKLTVTQLRDLIPMILLKHFSNPKLRQTLWDVAALFQNNLSEDVKLVVGIIVHAAHYSTTEGHLHTVKILKGLALNVRTVLTGIMLETKKCMKKKKCGAERVNILGNEKRLILGLYLFIKFVDARISYFKKQQPMTLFLEFLKLHETSLHVLSQCKSRRLILNYKIKGKWKERD